MAKKTLEQLVDEALENIKSDRDKILDAHDKLKSALDATNMEATAVIGGVAVKVLEQLTKSNEQIVRLAQIKERQESRTKQEESSDVFDIDEINKMYDKTEKEDN